MVQAKFRTGKDDSTVMAIENPADGPGKDWLDSAVDAAADEVPVHLISQRSSKPRVKPVPPLVGRPVRKAGQGRA